MTDQTHTDSKSSQLTVLRSNQLMLINQERHSNCLQKKKAADEDAKVIILSLKDHLYGIFCLLSFDSVEVEDATEPNFCLLEWLLYWVSVYCRKRKRLMKRRLVRRPKHRSTLTLCNYVCYYKEPLSMALLCLLFM